MSLSPIIQSHRVILCVGSGGVGKTTTAAAISLAAAKQGKRVLCLTIDPARRLAQSLGLVEFTGDAQRVPRELFERAKLDVPGSLTVMMLNTKRTFDEVVERFASSQEARVRIMNNRLYQHVSSALAGTQEYMAMEKLHAVRADPNYDLIVLDTPPTSNALDFLDAPDRLVDAIDSPATRWFVRDAQRSGKRSFDLLAKSAMVALRGVGRFTGSGFMELVAEFLSDINHLFGGFKARAREVQAALRGEDVAYVLVTSPSLMAIQEVLFFAERLHELGMAGDAFVVNRVHRSPGESPSKISIESAIQGRGLRLDDDAPERIAHAFSDEIRQAEVDARHLHVLSEALSKFTTKPLRVDVTAFAYDVHDLTSLDEVARVLSPPDGTK